MNTQPSFVDKQLECDLLTTIFNNTSEGIVLSNAQNQIIFVNPAFTKISGFEPADIQGKPGSFLRSGHEDASFYEQLWKTVQSKHHWEGEMWVRRKSGEIFLEWLDFTALVNAKNEITYYLAMFSDITSRKTSEKRIQFLSYNDPLTNLPNRRKFHDQLELSLVQANKNQLKLALLNLDIDRFKNISNSVGVTKGDLLLQAIAKRIKSCLRKEDFLARYDSDEFMIIVEDIPNTGNLVHITQKILDTMRQPFDIDNDHLYCTLSIGVSCFPEDGQESNELIKSAMSALHWAKTNGFNTAQFFRQEMYVHAKEILLLENNLHQALKRNEFELFYQPLVSLKTNKICGVEALIRWNSEVLGQVPPSRFIPIAEASGLIIPISEWVLRTACKANSDWLTVGYPPIPVSVNISSIDFHQKNFKNKIVQILQETNLKPHNLKLELTETIAMEDADSTIQTLLSLKELGLLLVIDDFGTGYSSLSYLKKYPIDQLKIDQSFVRNLENNAEDRQIIRAILSLAKTLKLTVVAEGVETIEQVNFLRNEGCDIIQGYYFSKPIPALEFLQLLEMDKGLDI